MTLMPALDTHGGLAQSYTAELLCEDHVHDLIYLLPPWLVLIGMSMDACLAWDNCTWDSNDTRCMPLDQDWRPFMYSPSKWYSPSNSHQIDPKHLACLVDLQLGQPEPHGVRTCKRVTASSELCNAMQHNPKKGSWVSLDL